MNLLIKKLNKKNLLLKMKFCLSKLLQSNTNNFHYNFPHSFSTKTNIPQSHFDLNQRNIFYDQQNNNIFAFSIVIKSMIPKNSSPHKTILKTFFDSNGINKNKSNQNQFQQGLKKQKASSFYGSFTPSYLKTPKQNLNYPNIDRDGKRSLTPRFQIKSPAVIKNELLKFKQQSSQQKTNLSSQSLTNRKYSQMNIKKLHSQQNNCHPQLNTKRQFVQNRIKKFQSLRSTINTSHLNSHEQRNSASKNINFQQQKKLSHVNETARAKFFNIKSDFVKEDQKFQLKPDQSNRLNYSPSDRYLDKKPLKTQSRFTISDHHSHSGLFQKPHNSQPLPKKQDSFTRPIEKFSKELETKKQNKIPSFLNAKNSKKNQQINFFKPKEFSKFLPTNLKSQKEKQLNKKLQNKGLSTNKHAKSFSVFQTLDFLKKDELHKVDFSSTAESFHPMQKTKQNQPQMIKNQFKELKNTKINVLKPKQKSLRISPNVENKIKIGSSSLRQSLTKKQTTLKQSCSIQRLNFDKKQAIHQILPITFLPSFSNTKNSLDSFKKTMHNSKVVNESQLSSSRKLSQQNQKGESTGTQKKSIIDDIKQTLIGCDLFSQQDYQNVIQNHKNDILKTQKSKHNEAPSVNFKIDLGLEKKTSIKEFIQFSDEQRTSDQRFSIQQEKKLAQLAQMCQQKRSKWILQQTDTIKQSLKQLSQFNTEKSLYDNEWKKISVKDFSTSRNNRTNQNYFRQIDEVREQDAYYQSKQDSKISSIRLLSQNGLQQNYRESSLDNPRSFKKNKQKSVRISSLENLQMEQNNQESIDKLSIQDFEILWSTQEPIFLNKSTENMKTLISYGARHKSTNWIYTLKKFEKKVLKDEGQQFLKKFINSLKLQFFTFNNSNIEKLYGIFEDRYNIYLVCEFTQTRLSQILIQEKNQNSDGQSQVSQEYVNLIKSEQKKSILLKQIINGVQEIHLQHLIHKNVHPNSVRVIFGACKISGFTQAEMIGQPNNQLCNEYVCPQALFDSSKLAMDIWCLGILAYELLIGQKPFKDESQDATKKVKKILECSFNIPFEKVALCEQFLNAALKRNPKDRASIFDLKNIWSCKLKENNYDKKSQYPLKVQLTKILQA